MRLLTQGQRRRLLQQGAQQRALQYRDQSEDFPPVVKLFTPDGAATWLLTELDPDDPDLAFGLCDLGLGAPELGYVRLSELEALRGGLGLPVERDRHFSGTEPLSAYLAAALAGVN